MIAQANCFRIPLPDKSVHCCVTSPPYWGLRKYSGDQGNEPLGLEPTPERHIERTVLWAREVYRVLRDDGVFWLNYGDCYSNLGHHGGQSSTLNQGSFKEYSREQRGYGLGHGNLMLMPHRIALALQADGWIVRQDLVWSKPNPMPESLAGWRRERQKKRVGFSENLRKSATNKGSFNEIGGNVWERDAFEPEYEYGPDYELRRGSWRHTRGHEYVFMLTKQMGYWSDQEAVRERLALPDAADGSRVFGGSSKHGANLQHGERTTGRVYDTAPSGRNPRSVLHIATAPYKGAHYATFPPALIAPLILATCPRWCCPVCGQGWAPVVEHSLSFESGSGKAGNPPDGKWAGSERLGTNDMRMGPTPHNRTLGHRSTCDHPHTQAQAMPGIVLDPFVGSGTTVMVAQELLRRGIGFDLSMEYLDLQATLRTGVGSPSNQFDNLPLFAQDEIES